ITYRFHHVNRRHTYFPQSISGCLTANGQADSITTAQKTQNQISNSFWNIEWIINPVQIY
ncbi:MAG TPA: hypothetical protein PKX58_11325, partial [Flexilinea sp.]|nr:hypothetical protein [Flexilinea sp.]